MSFRPGGFGLFLELWNLAKTRVWGEVHEQGDEVV